MRRSVVSALIVCLALSAPALAEPAVAPAPAPAAKPVAPAAKPVAPTKPAAAPAKPAATSPAAAKAPEKELWFVAKTGSGAIGYDAYSIKHDPNTGVATVTNALFLSAPQQSPEKKPFQYVVATDKIDCIGGQFQPQGRLLLSIDNKIVDQFAATDTKTWHSLAGNPPLAFLKRIVCTGNALGKSKQAPNFLAAMKVMREMAAAK
jgi:hypothetical protein